MSKLLKSVKEWNVSRKAATPELSRSQYSLVSCGELTPGALQLWVGLPEEIKYDPALASFRQLYEKEHGNVDSHQQVPRSSSVPRNKRLPLVSSAPHLNNNVHVLQEPPIGNGCTSHDRGIEMQEIGKQAEMSTKDVSRTTKMARTRVYIKLSILLACWVFFTVVFLMYNEKETVIRNSAIKAGEMKDYILHIPEDKLTLLVELKGPFLSQHMEKQLNASQLAKVHKMEVWLDRWTLRKGALKNQTSASDAITKESSKLWVIILQDDNQLDFNEGEPRSSKLHLRASDNPDPGRTFVYVIRMRSTTKYTIPFTISYTQNPIDTETGIIYACLLLCGLYVLIIFEVINRTMAAVIISMLSLAALCLAGERPSLQEIISWLDVETLLLLFSMMLLVAIMAETGIFDFLAVYTFEVTKGRMWPLINLLCAITALVSTVLDNVTTVLLMAPVTIRLCEVMDLNPVPILMWMVLYSNIGGTATPVGDPPNVIIASNRVVKEYGINFTNFTLHMSVGILLVCAQTYLQIRFLYRNANKLRLNTPRHVQDLSQQIAIWRRAAESLLQVSRDENIVRERLERKIMKLNTQLNTLIKESYKRACPKESFESTLSALKSKYKIRDKVLLVKTSIAVIFVVIVFFLHSIPELNRVSLGWTALLGALLLLVLADREDLEPVLHRVEWSTLLFFAALFVLTEALSKLGFIEYIGGMTESLIMRVDERGRLAVAILLMLWVSGLTSAFVDNIPLTTMMIRVVVSLGSNPTLNLPMRPLIWALSFGACLGGNGTLIGASANVVCAGVAEQHGYKFTFMQFFRMGFPIMVGHLIVASGYLLLCHCVFTWH